MENKLPYYEFVINENEEMSGVKTVSIVNEPAIESNFIAFENESPKPHYFKSNEYEQVVFGIALQPDFPIYRIDNEIGEYYGVFSKDTIKKIVHKFHKEQQSNNVNLEHNGNDYIDAYMFSDYIVDSELQIEDLKSKGILDAKIGSWVTMYKIEDPQVFQKVINGEFHGFSVECFLELKVFSKINKNKNKNEMKKNKKSLLDKIIALFSTENFERALVSELGFEIEWTEVGQPVNKVTVDAEGNETFEPVGQGEFSTDLGIVVTDEASNLVEVRPLPEEPVVTGDTSNQTGDVVPTEDMASYPWDQCISDQLAAGYSQDAAERICGSIKEKNMSVEEARLAEDNAQLADPVLDPNADPNMMPEGEPAPVQSLDKTISEVVGTLPGEYWIKVVVDANGMIEEAEVSSEVSLLRSQVNELNTKNETLLAKMEEPISEPILDSVVEEKDYNKMSAYEKSMYRRGLKA